MARVKWLDGMSVGVPAMDADHKKLFDLLNNIGEAMKADNREKAMTLCLDLHDLAIEHGKAEEALLQKIKFPDIHNVLMVQSQTIQGINELTALVESGEKPKAAVEKVANMQKTFIDYMLRGDINYKSYVQELRLDIDPGGAK